MEQTLQTLLRLIRCEIQGLRLTESMEPQQLEAVYHLAKRQDLVHFVGAALSRAGLLPPDALGAKLKRAFLAAIYSDETKTTALTNLQSILAEIPHMPLKGAILRNYYPEPWMRTRCDMDVLVHEADLDAAVAALTAAGYQAGVRSDHDVTLVSPDGLTLELHYQLSSAKDDSPAARTILRIWEGAVLVEGNTYTMSDAWVYVYTLYHMAKHIKGSGCGIRLFLDLWILEQLPEADRAGRQALVAQAELTAFAGTAQNLARHWFEDEPIDDLSQRLEQYVIRSGIYGTRVNSLTIGDQRAKGYFRGTVFKSYDILRERYPRLEGRPWLLPVYQVVRWVDLCRLGIVRQGLQNWNILRQIPEERRTETRGLLQELGLRE